MNSESNTNSQQELYDLAQIHQVKSRLNAKPIKSVIKRLMSERGYAAEQASQITLEHWRSTVGPELSRHSRPGNVRRGILYVEVSDSIVLQELHFQKTRIIKQLQACLPYAKIKGLQARIVTD